MNRWTAKLLSFLSCLALVAFTGAVQAQSGSPLNDSPLNVRSFPPDAKRGELVVLGAPDIAMDGKADRLSPGVRIRDASNALVLSGVFVNAKLIVNYTRDNLGLVQNIWVLNAEEIKQKMPGQSVGILSNIRSMFETPTVKDDGNTPFNQLPKYKQ